MSRITSQDVKRNFQILRQHNVANILKSREFYYGGSLPLFVSLLRTSSRRDLIRLQVTLTLSYYILLTRACIPPPPPGTEGEHSRDTRNASQIKFPNEDKGRRRESREIVGEVQPVSVAGRCKQSNYIGGTHVNPPVNARRVTGAGGSIRGGTPTPPALLPNTNGKRASRSGLQL